MLDKTNDSVLRVIYYRAMRTIINRINIGHSTKAERRFMELLKELHIPFKAKVKIAGREVDFVIGNYAIEIDGHSQDPFKNRMLIEKGYNPIHFYNWEINSSLKEWLKQIYGRNITISS